MNSDAIKNTIYLLFIASIFYFIVRKIFKVIKFNKLNKLGKGIYFSTFILLFYFFYKVIPIFLFRNSKITEGMSLMDSISSGGKDTNISGSIDYTKGWDSADSFRNNFCSKTPIFVDPSFFNNNSENPENSEGGLVYGYKSELYDSTTKKMNEKFVKEIKKQMEAGNKSDPTSFTKETGCLTNLKADIGGTGSATQMCNPKCNFKFTGASKKS
jgi:hypothetical protein